MRVHLTQKYVNERRPGTVQRVWDEEEGGLLLEIGKLDIRWSVQFDRRRDASGAPLPRPETVKVRLGRRDELSLKDARDRASEVKKAIRAGQNPNAVRRAEAAAVAAESQGAVTVRQAFAQKRAALAASGASPNTLTLYDYALAALAEIADKPLVEIGQDRRALRALRDRIAAGSHSRAGNAMKYLSAVYNHQMEVDDSLPSNPVEKAKLRPKVRRRAGRLHADDLPELRRRMRQIENPVRRALTQFIFLTGMRPDAARAVAVADLHLDKGYLHVPKPKGGTDAAFDLPLSRALVWLLRCRLRDNRRQFGPRCPWLFPAYDRKGELAHCRDIRVKPLPVGWVGSHMRKLYISRQGPAGVDADTGSFLVNHKISGARGHYAASQWDHMTACQEKMTRHLLGHCKPSATEVKMVASRNK